MKNYLNRVLLFTSVYGMSLAAFGGTAGSVTDAGFNPKEGLYLGAGVGTFFNDYTVYAVSQTNYVNDTTKNSNANVIGNLFVGIGYTAVNSLYLGGELGTNFPGRSTTIYDRPGVSIANGNIFSNTLRVQDYVTFDVLPGFRINTNWLAYARIGGAFANFQFFQDSNPVAPSEVISISNTRFGGRFGAGSTYAFNQYLSLSVDYFYAEYQKQSTFVPKYNIGYQNTGRYNYVGMSLTYTT